ncbi:MAG: hypothetical protein HY985_17285 [Magnetospirillum sp.]|nr:hypothetical protein [Magnetospirillum sp.]
MTQSPAHQVAAGSFVMADLESGRTLCLKVERISREHVNHYLVPLDPLGDRRGLMLIYVDPERMVTVRRGIALVLAETAAPAQPEVGDIFVTPRGPHLKVKDDPRAEKVFAYVELATGQVRPRMERDILHLLAWSLEGV